MHNRTKTVGRWLKNEEAIETRATTRREMRFVRENKDAMEILTENLEAAHEQERSMVGPIGGPIIDALKGFLEWLIANKEGILEFIKAIISLFMPTGLPDEEPAPAPV